MPSLAPPTPSQPAVASIAAPAKVEEVAEESKEEAKASEGDDQPKTYWKFAVKACYLKVIMLANCMEYAKPKRMMYEFAEPVLLKLLKHFVPEIFQAEARDDGIPVSLSEKVLPDHYHSFQHRRVYMKLRRMGYYVGEAERLYRQLLHDELKHYDLYDFGRFEEENPVVSEVVDEADAEKKEAEDTGDKPAIMGGDDSGRPAEEKKITV